MHAHSLNILTAMVANIDPSDLLNLLADASRGGQANLREVATRCATLVADVRGEDVLVAENSPVKAEDVSKVLAKVAPSSDRLLHSVKTKLNDHIKQFKAAFRRREVPTNTGKLSVEEVTLCTLEAVNATNCE